MSSINNAKRYLTLAAQGQIPDEIRAPDYSFLSDDSRFTIINSKTVGNFDLYYVPNSMLQSDETNNGVGQMTGKELMKQVVYIDAHLPENKATVIWSDELDEDGDSVYLVIKKLSHKTMITKCYFKEGIIYVDNTFSAVTTKIAELLRSTLLVHSNFDTAKQEEIDTEIQNFSDQSEPFSDLLTACYLALKHIENLEAASPANMNARPQIARRRAGGEDEANQVSPVSVRRLYVNENKGVVLEGIDDWDMDAEDLGGYVELAQEEAANDDYWPVDLADIPFGELPVHDNRGRRNAHGTHAYHYVAGHYRNYKSGLRSWVRGHYRGDPNKPVLNRVAKKRKR